MFDHVSIGVADIARSKKFYDAALKPLGYTRLSDGETSLGYGDKAVALWLGATQEAREGRHGLGPALLLRRPGIAPRSTPSMPQRSRPAARTTASPACAPTTGRSTTPPSSSIPTAIASRRIAESDACGDCVVAASNLEAMTTTSWKPRSAGRQGRRLRRPDPGLRRDPATRWTWPDPKAYLEAFPQLRQSFGGAAFGPRQRPPHRLGRGGALAAARRRPGRGGDRSRCCRHGRPWRRRSTARKSCSRWRATIRASRTGTCR